MTKNGFVAEVTFKSIKNLKIQRQKGLTQIINVPY